MITERQQHRVLVTGASGFVGRALSKHLAESQTFEVREAVRVASSVRPSQSLAVVGDINGETKWTSALSGIDIVVHLAARVHVMHDDAANPLAEFRRVNVDGTLALARQAVQAGVRRFVFLSSVKVNGEHGLFSERDTPAPADAYGISKLEAEEGLRDITISSGMAVTIIRPPLVYGPGVKANFRALLGAVQKGYPLPLGAVRNKRSLVGLDNLTSLIASALTHPRAANETFFASDGDDLSTTELIRRMAHAVGKPARLVPVPAWLLRAGTTVLGKGDMADRLLNSLQVDISKARALLGWTPPSSVDEGLRKVIAAL